MENEQAARSLIKKAKRNKGTGVNISVYFSMSCFDLLNDLRDKAESGDIRSVSNFISKAVIEKYNRDILKGE